MSQSDPGLFVVSNFSKHAQALRLDFDAAFGNPLKATAKRFVWDYWNIPGQYTLLRSPLASIFSEKNLMGFLDELSAWGQSELGMTTISEPWLSCYVEGCEQRFHTDAGHGPWAFVYSLTPDGFMRKAQGGFTRIAKHVGQINSIEEAREEVDLFTDVESRFNRLVAFDPRRPHAVERVRGVQDVREARLVIHGWFTDAQPFYGAKLSKRVARELLKSLDADVAETLGAHPTALSGLGVLRVGRSGQVEWVSQILVNLQSRSYLNRAECRSFLKNLQIRLDARPSWRVACRELAKAELTLPFEVA